ncbi:MAG: hypothetical protein AB7S72_18395 [Draconibacterium sp.]
MNLKDFEKKKDELIDSCKILDFQFGDTKYYEYKIGDYKFTTIYGYFHEEKLYSVQIRGEHMEYTSYDELMTGQSIALYKILKTKYGMPNQNYAIPDWYTLNHGDSNCLAFWKMGDKIVEMRIEKFRTNYYLNLEIFQSSISSKLEDEKRERKIKEEKEKVQKATEIL